MADGNKRSKSRQGEEAADTFSSELAKKLQHRTDASGVTDSAKSSEREKNTPPTSISPIEDVDPIEHVEPECEGLQPVLLSDVERQETQWLWDQRIALANSNSISGDPGAGKTFVVLDIAARVTTGRDMPDGSPNPFGGPKEVLWVSSEDFDADTVRPRFEELGGDPTKFHSHTGRPVKAVDKDDQIRDEFMDLSSHIKYIDEWLKRRPNVVLVIFDPVSAFLGNTPSQNTSLRNAILTPLADMANRRKVAVLYTNHLNKDGGDGRSKRPAMYRDLGSIAFVAACRASWLVTKGINDNDQRVFSQIKVSSQKTDVPSMAFTLIKGRQPAFQWEGTVDISADEALRQSQPVSGGKKTKKESAEEWILKNMEPGVWYQSDPLAEVAEKAGHLKKAFSDAKKILGITMKLGNVKQGKKGWECRLPPSDGP